jgi:hypothetical protein
MSEKRRTASRVATYAIFLVLLGVLQVLAFNAWYTDPPHGWEGPKPEAVAEHKTKQRHLVLFMLANGMALILLRQGLRTWNQTATGAMKVEEEIGIKVLAASSFLLPLLWFTPLKLHLTYYAFTLFMLALAWVWFAAFVHRMNVPRRHHAKWLPVFLPIALSGVLLMVWRGM